MKSNIIIWPLILLPIVCLQSQQREFDGAEASRIWEQMIEAKGGRSSLYQIETMVQEGRGQLRFGNPKFEDGEQHDVVALAFPDRMWTWGIAPVFGGGVRIVDLSVGIGYIGYPNNDIRKTSDFRAEKESLKDNQLIFLNETKWLKPKPVRVLIDKKIPRKVEAIETDLDGERVDFWIDREDHLPVKIITYRDFRHGKGLEPSDTWDLSQYQRMNGIQIPYLISTTMLSNPPSIRRGLPVLNPKLRPDLFTTPPTSRMDRTRGRASSLYLCSRFTT